VLQHAAVERHAAHRLFPATHAEQGKEFIACAIGRIGEEVAQLAAAAQHLADVGGGAKQGVGHRIAGEGLGMDVERSGDRRRHLPAMRECHLNRRREAALVAGHRSQQWIDRLDGTRDGGTQGTVRHRRTAQHALQRGKQAHPEASLNNVFGVVLP
jgi:hypothetical protein